MRGSFRCVLLVLLAPDRWRRLADGGADLSQRGRSGWSSATRRAGRSTSSRRLYGQALSVRLGQPVVIENKPGTGGNLASDTVAKAAPDGYTLLHGTDNVFIEQSAHLRAGCRSTRSRTWCRSTSLSSNQLVLAVHPSVPANDAPRVRRAGARHQAAAVLRLDRQRQPASSRHGDAQAARRHRSDPCAVSRRRAGRASRFVAGEVAAMFGGGSVVPTVQVGQGAGARLDRHGAQSGDAGAADHRRDLSRLRGADLARPVRAGRHAAADHRPAARRAEGRAGAARIRGTARRRGLRRALCRPRRRSSPPASRPTTKSTAS